GGVGRRSDSGSPIQPSIELHVPGGHNMAAKNVKPEGEIEIEAAELEAEYGRLALAVSQGDNIAAIKLSRVEEHLEAQIRIERRAVAAKVEAERLAAEVERQAAEGARQAEEAAYASALVC